MIINPSSRSNAFLWKDQKFAHQCEPSQSLSIKLSWVVEFHNLKFLPYRVSIIFSKNPGRYSPHAIRASQMNVREGGTDGQGRWVLTIWWSQSQKVGIEGSVSIHAPRTSPGKLRATTKVDNIQLSAQLQQQLPYHTVNSDSKCDTQDKGGDSCWSLPSALDFKDSPMVQYHEAVFLTVQWK